MSQTFVDWIDRVRTLEASGSEIHRYSGDVGKWVWNQMTRWNKLPAEVRKQLLNLRSFAFLKDKHADVEVHEWLRMFRLCEDYEAKEQSFSICHQQTWQEQPIGRWLTRARSDCVMKLNPKTGTKKYWEKLQTLRTIRNWQQERTISSAEKQQMAWDRAVHGLNRTTEHGLKRKPDQESAASVLQVAENASPDIIRAAYRTLSLKHHPDKGGNHDLYVKIQNAFQTLADK